MLYGRAVWDPVLIVSQIVAVQCVYYLAMGVLTSLLVGPYAQRLTLQHMFDWRWVSLQSFQGWMVATSFFLGALAAAVCLRFVVQRAKKCLDFAATMYIIHLLAVSINSGIPAHMTWWLTMVVNFAVTAVLGEWLCVQQEMREIPLASIPRNGGSAELTAVAVRK